MDAFQLQVIVLTNNVQYNKEGNIESNEVSLSEECEMVIPLESCWWLMIDNGWSVEDRCVEQILTNFIDTKSTRQLFTIC